MERERERCNEYTRAMVYVLFGKKKKGVSKKKIVQVLEYLLELSKSTFSKDYNSFLLMFLGFYQIKYIPCTVQNIWLKYLFFPKVCMIFTFHL